MKISLPNSLASALLVLLFAVLFCVFAYGIAVQRYRLFPYGFIAEFEEAVNWSVTQGKGELPWYYRPANLNAGTWQTDGFTDDRLNLVTSMGADDQVRISILDARGETLHEVSVDWFNIWPDATHLPSSDIPRSRPGTHIHGIQMMPDGDLIFNFEQLGLVRLTPCGEVVWKLAYRTHHSVEIDEQGYLWVSGQITHQEKLAAYPNHKPPFREPTILKVSTDGEILEEISVFDVFVANDLRGYLHLVTANNRNTIVTDDTLHLNDVERFPEAMTEGVFKHGDIMISLRNVSTVLIFDPETLKIRYISTGGFTRQHDPDFIDGDTFSVFDNNNIGPDSFGQQSRVLLISAVNDDVETWYEGTEEQPFYTDIMGKTQWLEEGNLLITDSRNGRGFQLNADKEIVWQYSNLVEPGMVGLVQEVQRLPASASTIFGSATTLSCEP